MQRAGSEGPNAGSARQCRLRLLPVRDELFQPDIGQRVVEQRVDHRRGAGADVRSHACRFDDVHRTARAGDENLGRELIVVEDLDDLVNQAHAGRRDIVKAADERADESRADLGSEQRLRRREDQRDVDADAFLRELLARLHAVARERHLDDDVLVDLGEVPPLAHHALELGGYHFRADRALDEIANPLQDLAIISSLFGQEGRVRGYAVYDAERHQRFDVFQVP